MYVTRLTTEQANAVEQEKLSQSRSLTGGRDSGIIKIDMQHFAKKSTDYPTIILPKDEYAHVMSEIATYISEEQKNMKVFLKAIGNYNYTVENNGFGNCRIIGKRLLDGE